MNNKTNQNIALVITTLASFLTPFMGSSINISLPSIGKEFNIDTVLLSWITTSYLLTTAVFLVPFGKIADIYGRKKIFGYGILVYLFSSIFSSISNSITMLILSRIFQGIGSSLIFVTSVAILISVFPVKERGKILGINAAAVYLGLSLGPFLGGFLTQNFGWRSIFILNIPISIIIALLLYFKLEGEWAESKGDKIDFIGSFIYGFILITLMTGFSLIPDITGIGFILISILGIIAFIKWEKKINNPVLDVSIFLNNIIFALSNLAALINYSATFAVTFMLSLFLQHINKFNPQNAGLILIAQPVAMVVFSPIAGKLSDKIEPRIIASIGMTLTSISLLFFTFLRENTSVYFIIGNLTLFGFGLALFSSPNTNAIMSSVDKKFYGIASGTLGTMRLIGQMFSMAISAVVLSVVMGRIKITQSVYHLFIKTIDITFIIFTILCFIGIFASLIRGKLR